MVVVICVTYNVYTWTLLSSDWSFLDILHETLPYKWHIASMVEFQRILKTKAKDVNTYKQYSLLIYLHLFWIMHRRNHIPGHFGVHGLSMAGLIIRDEASPRGPRGREVFCVFCFFSGFSPKIQVLSAGLQVGSEIWKCISFNKSNFNLKKVENCL